MHGIVRMHIQLYTSGKILRGYIGTGIMIDRETPLAEIVGQMSSRSTDIPTQSCMGLHVKTLQKTQD